jgi:hypothetical protein
MDECMDRLDRWVDGCMDGWMDRHGPARKCYTTQVEPVWRVSRRWEDGTRTVLGQEILRMRN